MAAITNPGFGREPLTHKFTSFTDGTSTFGFDDEIAFNTQSSSQWDSLCHWHHQASASAYNGTKADIAILGNPQTEHLPTLDKWHSRGGMVARGVLIDYLRYSREHDIHYDVLEPHEITVDAIEAVAKEQGIEFKTGDVLIIRSGYTTALGIAPAEKQKTLMDWYHACGVRGRPCYVAAIEVISSLTGS